MNNDGLDGCRGILAAIAATLLALVIVALLIAQVVTR